MDADSPFKFTTINHLGKQVLRDRGRDRYRDGQIVPNIEMYKKHEKKIQYCMAITNSHQQ